jgi:hypothetical protein
MNFAKTSLIHYFGDDSAIVLDSMVEELGETSFLRCRLNSFSVREPSRLRLIGRVAFGTCGWLVYVLLPSSVEVIEEWAFGDCGSLRELEFASGSRLRRIGKCAFDKCHSLSPIDVPSTAKVCGTVTVLARMCRQDGSKWMRVQFVQ